MTGWETFIFIAAPLISFSLGFMTCAAFAAGKLDDCTNCPNKECPWRQE
jgi:hypothetical protein